MATSYTSSDQVYCTLCDSKGPTYCTVVVFQPQERDIAEDGSLGGVLSDIEQREVDDSVEYHVYSELSAIRDQLHVSIKVPKSSTVFLALVLPMH